MSGTTFTWVGGADVDGPNNWTTPANWVVGGVAATAFPNSNTDVAVVSVDDGTKDAIISGGQTITVGSLTIDGNGHVIVGGSSGPNGVGGGGGGSLISLGTITITSTNSGGAIVGGTNGVISAPVMVVNGGDSVLIGGGGTFDVPTLVNNGGILADGGFFDLGPVVLNSTTISGTGFMEVSGPSAIEINAATAQELRVNVASTETATVIFDQPSAFAGGLNLLNPDSSVKFYFKGEDITGVAFDPDSHSLVISGPGGTLNTIPFTSNGTVALATGPSDRPGYGEITTGNAVCYARGTRIMTPDGEVPVEQLQPNQSVVTVGGDTMPIVWVGRRSVDLKRHPEPHLAQPVRIKAGAFGPALPRRDLLVSPAHAIYDEGVLIPARFLVNGRNVVQEDAESVEYFHIELERHDIMLAEGLPAESYLENNDRNRFDNGGGAVELHPDFARWNWDGRAYAELAVTGPAVEAVKAKLAQNAQARPSMRARTSRSRAA